MNVRLQQRVLKRKPRPLPAPQGSQPHAFGTIIRRTGTPSSRFARIARPCLLVLAISVLIAALLIGSHDFFRFLIFGGA